MVKNYNLVKITKKRCAYCKYLPISSPQWSSLPTSEVMIKSNTSSPFKVTNLSEFTIAHMFQGVSEIQRLLQKITTENLQIKVKLKYVVCKIMTTAKITRRNCTSCSNGNCIVFWLVTHFFKAKSANVWDNRLYKKNYPAFLLPKVNFTTIKS